LRFNGRDKAPRPLSSSIEKDDASQITHRHCFGSDLAMGWYGDGC
jgi:hypothetical protein